MQDLPSTAPARRHRITVSTMTSSESGVGGGVGEGGGGGGGGGGVGGTEQSASGHSSLSSWIWYFGQSSGFQRHGF